MDLKIVSINYIDDNTIDKICDWRNQDFVRTKMFARHIISLKEHRDYIDMVRKDDKRDMFVLYIDDVPFGVIQYKLYTSGNYVICGNYLINEADQDKGLGTMLVFFQNDIVFKYTECNKIYSEVLSYNKAALSINKKIGGVQEGILRQQVHMDGKYYDIYCFGLLREEWTAIKNKYEKYIYDSIENSKVIV